MIQSTLIVSPYSSDIKSPYPLYVGRDSSVGIAIRYGLDGPGIESRWGDRFSAPVQTDPEAHTASYTMGTEPSWG
jgi:hypothetical protein